MNNQRGHGGPDICRRPFSLVLISWLFYQPQERHSHAMLHKLKPSVPGGFIMGSATFQSGPSFYALGGDESAPPCGWRTNRKPKMWTQRATRITQALHN